MFTNCSFFNNQANLLDWYYSVGGGVVGSFTYYSTAECPADVNGDGTVSVNDLLMLIGAWGNCE